jgi:hypothetical protein
MREIQISHFKKKLIIIFLDEEAPKSETSKGPEEGYFNPGLIELQSKIFSFAKT